MDFRMGRTTELRSELKERFYPWVIQKGFVADMRHAPHFVVFRKITTRTVYVFDIQWEKYGRPRFVVNFGKCGAKGASFNGNHVEPKNVQPNETSGYGRLTPNKGATTGSWFRQDKPLLQRALTFSKLYPANKPVDELLALFPELEAFWKDDTVGPHLRAMTQDNPNIKDAA